MARRPRPLGRAPDVGLGGPPGGAGGGFGPDDLRAALAPRRPGGLGVPAAVARRPRSTSRAPAAGHGGPDVQLPRGEAAARGRGRARAAGAGGGGGPPGAAQRRVEGGARTQAVAKLVVTSVAARRTAAAEQLSSEAVQGCSPTAARAFHLLVLRASANMRCPGAAAWCLGHLQRNGHVLDTAMINAVLNVFAKLGDVSTAEHYWRVMQNAGLLPNVVSFNLMLNACAQAHDAERAEWWFCEMLSRGERPSRISYGTLVGAHAKLGNVQRAEAWSERMSEAGFDADEIVFNSLINACAKAGMQQKAEQLVNTMLSRNIVPTRKAYHGVIQACITSGDLSVAESWFARMNIAGCTADVVTFSSMIYVAVGTGNAQRAEHWMRRMLSHGMCPNVECFNTLLHAFARRGDYRRAVEWKSQMWLRGVAPNEITFNTMIHASLTGGTQADMKLWLRRMLEEGFQPDQVTLSTLSRSRSVGAGPGASAAEGAARPSEWARAAGAAAARPRVEDGTPPPHRMLPRRPRGLGRPLDGPAWPAPQRIVLAGAPHAATSSSGPGPGGRVRGQRDGAARSWQASLASSVSASSSPAAGGAQSPPGGAVIAPRPAAAVLRSSWPQPQGSCPAGPAPCAQVPPPWHVPRPRLATPGWGCPARQGPSRRPAMADGELAEAPRDTRPPARAQAPQQGPWLGHERPAWRPAGALGGTAGPALPEPGAWLAHTTRARATASSCGGRPGVRGPEEAPPAGCELAGWMRRGGPRGWGAPRSRTA